MANSPVVNTEHLSFQRVYILAPALQAPSSGSRLEWTVGENPEGKEER